MGGLWLGVGQASWRKRRWQEEVESDEDGRDGDWYGSDMVIAVLCRRIQRGLLACLLD